MMKLFAFYAVSGALLAADVSATSTDGYILADLTRKPDQSAYLANFSVGTPAQHQALLVDTGSSTYSFLSPRNPTCNVTDSPCIFGTYDNETSSTARYVGGSFSDDLIDHGFGNFVNDTVSLGGVSLSPGTFGYLEGFAGTGGEVVKPTTTILGLALRCQFALAGSPNCTVGGASYLQELYNASAVGRRALSLYLGPDRREAAGAQLLLGGFYDRAKQAAEPFTLPMVDPTNAQLSNGQTNSVNLTRISAVQGNGSRVDAQIGPSATTAVGAPVLLDSGSPQISIPGDVFEVFFDWAGKPSRINNAVGYYYVDCALSEPGDNPDGGPRLEFEFGAGNVINVPFYSLISHIEDDDSVCGAYVLNAGNVSNPGPQGDPLLRSMYITYDNDALKVTIAQVKYTSETDIVPIPSGGL